MRFKNLLATGLISATLLGTTTNTHAQTTSFRDVPKGHWSEEAINYLAAKGVVSGYGNGNFDYLSNITRGQVSAIIARYLHLQNNGTTLKQFSDIQGHMFEGNIKAVAQAGIMNGDNSNKFRPDDTLTRYEMAVILQKAFHLHTKADYTFQDVPKNHWATDYVRALYSNGVTSGVGQYQYGGQMTVTRGQFAKFMYNAIFVDPNFEPEKIPEKDKSEGEYAEMTKYALSLGLFERDWTLVYNRNGAQGSHSDDLMQYNVASDSIKVHGIYIIKNDPALNEPLRKLIDALAPTKSEYIYNMIFDKKITKKRFEADGREVEIYKSHDEYGDLKSVRFSTLGGKL